MSIPPARRRSKASTRDALVEGLRARGHRNVLPLDAPDDLAATIADLAQPGDFVVCLGAGSITNWAQALPAELDALATRRNAAERGMMAARNDARPSASTACRRCAAASPQMRRWRR